MSRRRPAGFTLLEVMVALAIFATVAAAVLTATGRGLNNASRLTDLTLAGWIADNRLTELQLARPTPTPGRETQQLHYAGRQWQVESAVEASSDPGMLRATVWVALAEASARTAPNERALTSLTGFVEVP
ncbi:type II secretion system minor pseudopilin GspI [Stutzerimonas tarimensis]|uniref:Type II secretion system protein I n=1 Tax=Stutzerimonas tarimensis TaxID=1507735 RepID=A0ABV7T6G6_9GAMM